MPENGVTESSSQARGHVSPTASVRWAKGDKDALDKVGHVLRSLLVIHRDDRMNVCCLAHVQKLEDAPAGRRKLLIPGAIKRLSVVRRAFGATTQADSKTG